MIDYQVFGSHDSIDCDIMVFVESIGSIAECRDVIRSYEAQLQKLYTKNVNCNLAVVKGGFVVDVFKGTPDEVNNSLFTTYNLHTQHIQPMITGMVKRDSGLKALRSMRAVLSFISRTQYRVEVKRALAGTAVDRHSTLTNIDLGKIVDLGSKNTDVIEFRKMSAFQMGQSYLLNIGIEVYTKAALVDALPMLRKFTFRQEDEPSILEAFKGKWLKSFDPKLIPQSEALRG